MASRSVAPRNQMPYTEQDIAFLRANHGKMPLGKLAQAMGRGPCALYPLIRRLKLKRYWTAEEDAIVRANQGLGWGGWGRIAKQLKRTAVSVRSRAARLGCENRHLVPPDLERVKALHAQGLVCQQIGERLGVSDECVRHWLNKLQLPLNPRREALRIESMRLSLLAKHGVDNPNRVAIIRRRKMLAEILGVEELGSMPPAAAVVLAAMRRYGRPATKFELSRECKRIVLGKKLRFRTFGWHAVLRGTKWLREHGYINILGGGPLLRVFTLDGTVPAMSDRRAGRDQRRAKTIAALSTLSRQLEDAACQHSR